MKKTVKQIGNYEIEISNFNAIEAMEIKGDIISFVQKSFQNINSNSIATIVPILLEIIYKLPPSLCIKLFSKCKTSVENSQGVKGDVFISTKEIFNTVFEDNLDGIIELALEVMEVNGFFTINTILVIINKIPRSVKEKIKNWIPIMDIMNHFQDLKKN